MKIAPTLLQQATGCTAERADLYAGHLAEACAAYQIDTPERLAAFLAQVGHESGSLRYSSEVWGPTPAQERYEGRADLGNTQPGDGRAYAGHGLIQTTGRANHRAVRGRLRARGLDCPDFEANPNLLTTPKWASWSAADYWDMRGLNALADAGEIIKIGRAINRGNALSQFPANGEADRLQRWERAKAALAAMPAEPGQAEQPIVHLGPEPVAEPAPLPTVAPRPDLDPYMQPPAPAPAERKPMVPIAASFLWGLAQNVISIFTPLAQEKISKEIGRHVDKPEIADQLATTLIESAKALTGKADPVEAVAAVKANPDAVRQLEATALENIDKLMPVLDKLAAWDQQAWAAEEASRGAADERAKSAEKDQDEFLTRAIVGMVTGLMVTLVALIGGLMYLGADTGTIGTLVGLFAGAGGAIVGGLNTRIQHRYGSSRGSAAKDVLTAELARRPKV